MAKTEAKYAGIGQKAPSRWRYVIPKLLAVATGKDRYLPDIEWVGGSWTHNVFRAYEWLCFRRLGMRPEVSISHYVDEDGVERTVRQFHTFEAAVAHAESAAREALRRVRSPREWGWFNDLAHALASVRVRVPAVSGGFALPSQFGYLFAIAYDSVSTLQDSSSASSLSVAFSTSGTDRLLVGAIKAYRNPNNTGTVSAFTYNSVGLTAITNSPQTPVQTNGRLYMSYLVAPATGSNTLSCTFGNSATNGSMVATLYTGAKQTGQPDATTNGSAGGTGATATLTVVAANSWLVLAAMSMFGPNSISASTGATERASGGNPDLFLADSNGGVAAGSQSIAFTCGNDNYGYLAASFAQASTDVTVSATVLTATTSTPAPSVSGGATVSPTAKTATFSTPAPSVSGAANVAASVVTATFSIPAVNVITPDAQVSVGVVTATFSLPAPAVGGGAGVAASVVTATFSQPAASVRIDAQIAAAAQVAMFSVPSPTVSAESNASVAAGVVTATFSLPTPTVTGEQNAVATPSVLTATFSLPTPTVTAVRNVEVAASVVSATFSVQPPRKVGGLWTAQPRVEGTWTPQARAI